MKKKQNILPKLMVILVSGGLGALAAIKGIDVAKGMSGSHVIALAFFLLPAFIIVIAVHEAGHAFAGVWVRFDFRMYVVGPFMWEKGPAGWGFKLNKNVNLFGGLVFCVPTDSENLARRFALFALGGPAASLMFTAIAFGVKQLITHYNTMQPSGWELIASMFSQMGYLSFFIFLLTIIPLYAGGFYTDGARAIRFLRGGDLSRFELLLLNAVSRSSAGFRPRALNKAELQEALKLGNKLNAPMKVYLHAYLHQIGLDNNDADTAEKHLQDYLAEIESIPQGLRGMANLAAAFFYAYECKDLAQAEQYWNLFVPSAMIPKAQVLATEAAIGLLKNEQGANAKIEQALKEIPNMMDRGAGIALREQLMLLRKELLSRA